MTCCFLDSQYWLTRNAVTRRWITFDTPTKLLVNENESRLSRFRFNYLLLVSWIIHLSQGYNFKTIEIIFNKFNDKINFYVQNKKRIFNRFDVSRLWICKALLRYYFDYCYPSYCFRLLDDIKTILSCILLSFAPIHLINSKRIHTTYLVLLAENANSRMIKFKWA